MWKTLAVTGSPRCALNCGHLRLFLGKLFALRRKRHPSVVSIAGPVTWSSRGAGRATASSSWIGHLPQNRLRESHCLSHCSCFVFVCGRLSAGLLCSSCSFWPRGLFSGTTSIYISGSLSWASHSCWGKNFRNELRTDLRFLPPIRSWEWKSVLKTRTMGQCDWL